MIGGACRNYWCCRLQLLKCKDQYGGVSVHLLVHVDVLQRGICVRRFECE